MNTRTFLFSVLLMFGVGGFVSCEKEVDETEVIMESLEQDDEVVDYFDDLLAEIDDLTYTNFNAKSGFLPENGPKGKRSVITAYSGDTIIHTITYGGFVHPNSPNGRVKNGNVVIKVIGHPQQATFWRQISVKNFKMNGNEIFGVKTINKVGDLQFAITLTEGMIRFANGSTYTRTFSLTRTQITGANSPFFIWDDEFISEGNASGINQHGEHYTHAITLPLVNRRNCRWIVQGAIEFVVGDASAQLDYGDGNCDKEASLTVNGRTSVIDLRPEKQRP